MSFQSTPAKQAEAPAGRALCPPLLRGRGDWFQSTPAKQAEARSASGAVEDLAPIGFNPRPLSRRKHRTIRESPSGPGMLFQSTPAKQAEAPAAEAVRAMEACCEDRFQSTPAKQAEAQQS